MFVIECRNVRKRFGSFEALKGVSFNVEENKCLAFIGPNGAGKTTTIRILAGLARPTTGTVRVSGVDVIRKPDQVRTKIGYLAQSPSYYNWMSGEEYLMFCAEIFKLPKAEGRKRTSELLELTGLKGAEKRKIGGYSGGMKQRLGIAQALINRPQVVFLDEPVSSLDPIGRHEILELVRSLKSQTTVFFSTHVLNDADQVCDEVVILKDGAVVLQSSIDELQMRYAAPVFEIELENHTERVVKGLPQQPWYVSHQLIGPALTVMVRDVEMAKTGLPKFLIDCEATIRRYQVQIPNLEQVFLKVVNMDDSHVEKRV